VENSYSSRISGIFENDRIPGPNKRFADEVERLLATVGNEQILVFRCDAVAPQHLEQGFFQRRVPVRGAQIQNVAAFAPQNAGDARLQLFYREKLLRGTRHDKGQGPFRYAGGQSRKNFFTPIVGKEQLPTHALMTVQHRRSRGSDLQTIAIATNKGS